MLLLSVSIHEQTQMFVRTADGDGRGSLPVFSWSKQQGKVPIFGESSIYASAVRTI